MTETTTFYNLTWGEYGNSLTNTVQMLRCQGDLVDVTLAAEGKTFQAHKVVLSAASPFLLEILKSTTCKHPIIMLAGVQATDLEALIEFVYRGEVSVYQNQLPSLLQAAHCLNIQGLANNEEICNEFNQHISNTTDDVKYETASRTENETVSEGVESPVTKKRKRAKRLKHDLDHVKWSKVYVQVNPDILTTSSSSSLTAGGEIIEPLENQQWEQPMNINLTTTTVDALSLQTPIIVQNLPIGHIASANSSPGPKIRGASDQPGTCPLCGAMLRQARNLRRHLLTSCKYRMIAGQKNSTTSTASSSQENESPESSTKTTQLHELQTISVENLEQVNRVQNLEGNLSENNNSSSDNIIDFK